MTIHIVNPCNDCGNNKIDVYLEKNIWYGKCITPHCPERISGGGTEKSILVLWNKEHGQIEDFISLSKQRGQIKKKCAINHCYLGSSPKVKTRKSLVIGYDTIAYNNISEYKYYTIKVHPAKFRYVVAILLTNEPKATYKTSILYRNSAEKICFIHIDLTLLFKHLNIIEWEQGQSFPLTYYKDNNYFLIDFTDLVKSQKNPIEIIK